MNKPNPDKEEVIRLFDRFLHQEYGLDLNEFLAEQKPKSPEALTIPLPIFATELSTLESAIKYLHEVQGKPFSAISILLNRPAASLTSAYRRSLQKHPHHLADRPFTDSIIKVPVKIFADRRLAPLEALISFLAGMELRQCDIARMLRISQSTVWTVHARTKKKQNRQKGDSTGVVS